MDLEILVRPGVTISAAQQRKISAVVVEILVHRDVTISAARKWKILVLDVEVSLNIIQKFILKLCIEPYIYTYINGARVEAPGIAQPKMDSSFE